MLEKFDDVVFYNDDIDHGNFDSDTVTFVSDDVGLVTIDLNNIDLLTTNVPIYRNQSVDLLCKSNKSTDWFLYDWNNSR